MLPPCSCTAISCVVGLPGAAPPPQRLLYALQPTSSRARVDNVFTQLACVMRFGGVEYVAVSGADVAPPPMIHPSVLSRHALPAVAPGQRAPEHPHCSSQKPVSLFLALSCHVRRTAPERVLPAPRAGRVRSGSYVHEFGSPALRLANMPGTDDELPWLRATKKNQSRSRATGPPTLASTSHNLSRSPGDRSPAARNSSL